MTIMNKILVNEKELVIKSDDKLELVENTNLIFQNQEAIEVTLYLKASITMNIYFQRSSKVILHIFQEDVSLTMNYHQQKENSEVKVFHRIINNSNMSSTINIYQESSNVIGNYYHHGLNKGQDLLLTVNGYIPKDLHSCILNQENKIITNNMESVRIRPNLYVDTQDVIANHGAYIGNFPQDNIFYLQSRGLNKNEATNLLVKGFLWLSE